MTFPPAALNQPALVASIGAGALASFPALQASALSIPVSYLKVINALAFFINMYAITVPGRLDGESSTDPVNGENPFLNRILVAPAGWAFGIWGVIFLGELVFSLAQFSSVASSIEPLLKEIAIPFAMAQLFQILWAASFRSKYKGKWMAVSATMLPAIALSLSKAHAIFTKSVYQSTLLQYCIFFLPLTIHFGWTTAASLVNLNGAIARDSSSSNSLVKVAGHLSLFGATAIGVYLTKSRAAPVYGAVISWALFGIFDEMRRRLIKFKSSESAEDNKSFKKSTQLQKFLALAGGLISSAASLLVATIFKNASSFSGVDLNP